MAVGRTLPQKGREELLVRLEKQFRPNDRYLSSMQIQRYEATDKNPHGQAEQLAVIVNRL